MPVKKQVLKFKVISIVVIEMIFSSKYYSFDHIIEIDGPCKGYALQSVCMDLEIFPTTLMRFNIRDI